MTLERVILEFTRFLRDLSLFSSDLFCYNFF